MGMDWDPQVTGAVIEQWAAWGFARHSNFMRPAGVAQAIVAVVGLPRGTHATVIELQPEAPLHAAPQPTETNRQGPNRQGPNRQGEP